MKKQRTKTISKITILLLILLVLFTTNLFAYGEQIQSSLTNLLNWITKVLGGLAIAFGIVFTGIKISIGDEHALKNGAKILGGGILIFSATNIVNFLKAIFGA